MDLVGEKFPSLSLSFSGAKFLTLWDNIYNGLLGTLREMNIATECTIVYCLLECTTECDSLSLLHSPKSAPTVGGFPPPQ